MTDENLFTDIEMKSFFRTLKKWAALGTALFALNLCSFTVDQSEQAVVTSFGNPTRVILNPTSNDKDNKKDIVLETNYKKEGISVSHGAGLHFKAPWQSVKKIDRRFEMWNTGSPEEITTKDKNYIFVDIAAPWRAEDPLTFIRKIGYNLAAVGRLDTTLDSKLRDSLPHYALSDIVRTDNRPLSVIEKELENPGALDKVTVGRQRILDQISQDSSTEAAQYGIEIMPSGAVFATRVGYVESVKKKIEATMSSERLKVAQKYLSEGKGEADKILGEKERESQRALSEATKRAGEIRGFADGQATVIYAEGYTDTNAKTGVKTTYVGYNTDPEFYAFFKTLQVYQSMKDQHFAIGTDNELFRTLKTGKSK